MLCFLFLGNHSQVSRVPVAIKVLDVNDNAPEFASEHEAFLCENGKPGQVSVSMVLCCVLWCVRTGCSFSLSSYLISKICAYVFMLTTLNIRLR